MAVAVGVAWITLFKFSLYARGKKKPHHNLNQCTVLKYSGYCALAL